MPALPNDIKALVDEFHDLPAYQQAKYRANVTEDGADRRSALEIEIEAAEQWQRRKT